MLYWWVALACEFWAVWRKGIFGTLGGRSTLGHGIFKGPLLMGGELLVSVGISSAISPYCRLWVTRFTLVESKHQIWLECPGGWLLDDWPEDWFSDVLTRPCDGKGFLKTVSWFTGGGAGWVPGWPYRALAWSVASFNWSNSGRREQLAHKHHK